MFIGLAIRVYEHLLYNLGLVESNARDLIG